MFLRTTCLMYIPTGFRLRRPILIFITCSDFSTSSSRSVPVWEMGLSFGSFPRTCFINKLKLVVVAGILLRYFCRAKSLRTPSNMLVVNLAILDFIMMVKMPVFIVNSFNEGPIWGKSGCDFYALLGSYSGFGGAVTNAAIAFDRYR